MLLFWSMNPDVIPRKQFVEAELFIVLLYRVQLNSKSKDMIIGE